MFVVLFFDPNQMSWWQMHAVLSATMCECVCVDFLSTKARVLAWELLHLSRDLMWLKERMKV